MHNMAQCDYFKRIMHFLFYKFLVILFILHTGKSANAQQPHPNILIIIADDLGIGDLGCYGNDTIKTPNIDRLASEGLKLTHHLAAASLCTPSRAALMTSRYPSRFGLVGEENTAPVIMHIASQAGLPHEEITLAEALSANKYFTAAVGKWHLGSECGLFGTDCQGPKKHGFHYFYGSPVTLLSDFHGDPPFWPFQLKDPVKKNFVVAFLLIVLTTIWLKREAPWLKIALVVSIELFLLLICLLFLTHVKYHTANWWEVSPWLRQRVDGLLNNNVEMVYRKLPFPGLMQELVNQSVQFINSASKNKETFFLYHSFTHVHTPMFVAQENEGRSAFGRYGDNIEEMDDGVGELLKTLTDNSIEDDTIVYFVSDHGGHLEVLDPDTGQRAGGHNKEFKGGKFQGGPEGGIRVPGILRWPQKIPANSTLDHPISLLDMMPTLLHLAGLPPIEETFKNSNELDGQNMGKLILNPNKIPSGKRILLHHCRRAIHALRLIQGDKVYKMYLKLHKYFENSTQCGWGEVYCDCYSDDVIDVSHQPHLYELTTDPYEDHMIDPTTQEYKDVVSELLEYLKKWNARVVYPPSQYSKFLNIAFIPWLQPL